MMICPWCGAAKEPDDRRMPSISLGTLLFTVVMILCVIGLAPMRTGGDDASRADTSSVVRLSSDCAVLQQLRYEPCQHTVTRREALPDALRGKTRADLEGYYADWQVTSYAAGEVQMTQTLPIYCPQHVVLKADESGCLCVWQNTYGDALGLVREIGTPLSDFTDEVQAQLRFGLGFDTAEALTQWLESAES